MHNTKVITDTKEQDSHIYYFEIYEVEPYEIVDIQLFLA